MLCGAVGSISSALKCLKGSIFSALASSRSPTGTPIWLGVKGGDSWSHPRGAARLSVICKTCRDGLAQGEQIPSHPCSQPKLLAQL